MGGEFACRSAATFAAAGIEDSQRAYVKIQKEFDALRAGKERAKSALQHSAHAQCGKVPQFVFFAAVIPSLVEPVRAGSLL